MLVEEHGTAKRSIQPVSSLIENSPEKTKALQSEEHVSNPVHFLHPSSVYFYSLILHAMVYKPPVSTAAVQNSRM